MVNRSPEYEALAREFSARMGFDARGILEDLIGNIEKGLRRAARSPHDLDRITGIDAAIRKYIRTLPNMLGRMSPVIVGNAYWAIEKYSKALNLGVTRVPWQVSFTSAPLPTWGAVLEMESCDGLGDYLLDTYYGMLKKGRIQEPGCTISFAHHYPELAPHTNEPEQHNKLCLEVKF
jgi:hypothetical protein